MRHINKFVSSVPDSMKTPSMRVKVTTESGALVEEFHAPKGFKLEQYATAQWSDCDSYKQMIFELDITKECFVVEAKIEGNLVERYEGTYNVA